MKRFFGLLWWFFKILLKPRVFLTLLGFLCLYLFYLNFQISSKFEGRRWNLPSRIYSDSFQIFDGKILTSQELETRLEYLSYRKVNLPQHHGEYFVNGNSYTIFLHSFDYPHHKVEGYPISFDVEENQIKNLRRADENKKMSLTQLEPELVASIFDEHMEDRTFVTLDKIPNELVQALILIEDERFYGHHGVDFKGILRAMFVNVIHGGFVQGGSTLTQQLVKNYFLHHRKTLIRKINEIFMALIMEVRYSKEEILEAYLNEIYFGQKGAASISGVVEASRFYFSKNIDQISVAESALLAALVKSPGLYSPFFQKEKALKRRNLILKKLFENDIIKKSIYQQSIKIPLPTKSPKSHSTNAPFFVEFVKKQLKEHYSQDILSSQGMRIFTTLDMVKQRAAEKSVQESLSQLEKSRDYLKKKAAQKIFLEAALIALDPQTGFIEAYVGGRDFTQNQFDHVSQAKRQPGSVFKPFVYLAALDPERDGASTFTLSSVLQDNEISFQTPEGKWQPQNYDKVFHGEVSLRMALERSYNVATVWLGNEIGFEAVVKMAKKAGLAGHLKPYPSLVLGAFEATPLEMAAAYSIFPNQGVKNIPLSIRRVVTKEGEVLEKKSFEMARVISKELAYLMNRVLMGVMDSGTAASVRSRGFLKLAAGKTGTTSNYRDAWFVGFTPDQLALVWVGYSQNDVTHLSGASGALPIWTEYMKVATSGKTYHDFPVPPQIIKVKVDKATGLLYDRSCGEPFEEYFIEGTEPLEFCDDN